MQLYNKLKTEMKAVLDVFSQNDNRIMCFHYGKSNGNSEITF